MNILTNLPFCSLTSFWIVSLNPFNNKPESSRDLTILIKPSFSLFDTISIVLLYEAEDGGRRDSKIFLCIPASAADVAAVNCNGV